MNFPRKTIEYNGDGLSRLVVYCTDDASVLKFLAPCDYVWINLLHICFNGKIPARN